MKIACWSGPRNISTALMRSWSSRTDTSVIDEPFYAYYLKEKKLKHPMYKEIINHYPYKYKDVVRLITKEFPESKAISYQKHMAHHLINLDQLEWIKNFKNCFLIRHPKSVISSYLVKNTLNHVDELGYPQQYDLIKYLKKYDKSFIVIDSSDLLKNPENLLRHWCKYLNIEYENNMLQWKKGHYATDGIWWKHWYNNIVSTDRFKIFEKKNTSLPKECKLIYDEALYYYHELYKLIQYKKISLKRK